MSIWVKICKYLDFGRNCRAISILVNNQENLDFGQSLWKSRFWSKLWKIFDLHWNLKNLDFGKYLPKPPMWLKFSKNLDFDRNFPNCWFWTKLQKLLVIAKFVLICANICQYLDFVQNFRKLSILVDIYENLGFGQSLWKSRFWSKLSENLDFSQYLR